MKKGIIIAFVMLGFSVISYSQAISDISKVSSISKGKIFLKDNYIMNFKKLKVLNDTVMFTSPEYGTYKYAATDISKIYKTKNTFLEGVLIGGAFGFACGYFGSREAIRPEDREENKDIITEVTLGFTGGFMLVGAVAGAIIKKNKLVYKNLSSLSFQPDLFFNQYGDTHISLTCRITIN